MLDELICSYGEHNAALTSMRKVCDSENKQIKDIMKQENMEVREAGGYKVTRSVSYRESFNEEQMLSVLKEDWKLRNGDLTCPYIKTKEYVDMDALETALYGDMIPDKVVLKLNDCKTSTEVVTLRCTKAKPKKEEE